MDTKLDTNTDIGGCILQVDLFSDVFAEVVCRICTESKKDMGLVVDSHSSCCCKCRHDIRVLLVMFLINILDMLSEWLSRIDEVICSMAPYNNVSSLTKKTNE